MAEKKNCGCGKDPCETYGHKHEAYNINASAGDMDMIHKIFDGLDDEQKTQIQRELTVKVRGISVPPIGGGLGKLKDRNPNDKDIADMPLSQLQKQFSDVLSDDISRLKKLSGISEVAGPKDCWDGKAPGAQGGPKTKAGTGKNKGKRVNNCEPIKAPK